MNIRIILLFFLFTFLSLNSVNAELNPQNVTIRLHQVWEFSSETDASVTDIISTNEDWIISGNIGLFQNSEVVNYFAYIDDPNSLPKISIYRPTIKNRINAPDYNLSKDKTLIRKYTILRVSSPNLNASYFPFDKYDFSLYIPVRDYNQIYSADIIFPASFEIKNVTISRPLIEQQNIEGVIFTFAGIGKRNKISESKSIEEYKYNAYVPLIEVQNSFMVDKYTRHVQDSDKNYLVIKYTYGRPTYFMLIFFVSIVFMFLITYLSYPLSNKNDIIKYILTIGSIWVGQEGVSFLQGHRPLSITLYDFTIIFILICVIIIYCYPLLLNLKDFITSKQNRVK